MSTSNEVKQPELFREKVDEGAQVKQELKQTYRQLNGVMSVWSKLLNISPKSIRTIKDIVFYKEGIPNPDSPAKLDTTIERFAAIVKLLKFEGGEEAKRLEGALERAGLKVELVTPCENMFNDLPPADKKLAKKWSLLFQGDAVPGDAHTIFTKCLAATQTLQEHALDKMTVLRGELAEEVNTQCEVKPSNYMKTVQLASLQLENAAKAKQKADELLENNKQIEVAVGTINLN